MFKVTVKAFSPPPMVNVSEWSDRYRMLSQRASAEPGKWKTDRTPYLKDIMDALTAWSPYTQVVFQKGAQIGATESSNNWLGYIIDYTPGPTLFVSPTLDTAKKISRQRIAPLIDETPCLKSKVAENKSRDAANTMLLKEFQGGMLILIGANSNNALRSLPIKYVCFDEVDSYPPSEEGDVIQLGLARTRTFNSKAYLISTPTLKGKSKIEEYFNQSDKRYFHLPCPHCDHYQPLVWERFSWPEGEPDKVKFQCESCKKPIEEYHKTEMLSRGKWIATNPGASGGKVAGFHLSSLYSPVGWLSWEEIAREYEECKNDEQRLIAFTNTILGETYDACSEAPDWEILYNRREDFKPNIIPKQCLLLTAAIDVQKNRLELMIVAWTPNKESYVVDRRIIPHGVYSNKAWELASYLMQEKFEHELGGTKSIDLLLIDSGWQPLKVYEWVKRQNPNRVKAIKGQDSLTVPVGPPKPIEFNIKGKRVRQGISWWPVGVSVIKSEIYGWLQQTQPAEDQDFPTGYMHFNNALDADFFKELTSETLEAKLSKTGRYSYQWIKNGKNEVLDLTVYNRAAFFLLGGDRFQQPIWDKLRLDQVRQTSQQKQTKLTRKSSFWEKS